MNRLYSLPVIVFFTIMFPLAVFAAHAHTADSSNSHMIRLVSYEFDVRNGEPDLPDDLQMESDHGSGAYDYYLVKLSGPVLADWRRNLLNHVEEIYAYIPDYAYLVRITHERLHEVESLNFVEWVGLYRPGYRFDRKTLFPFNVRELVQKYSDKSCSPVSFHRQYTVQLFSHEDIDIKLQELNGLGVTCLEWSEGEFFSDIRIETDPSHNWMNTCNNIARLHGVAWIERYYVPEPVNDDTCWVGQSYDTTGHSTPVWNNGLTGTDQIIAICDTGLDADMCFFWDNAQGLPNATVNPLQRKVLSYHDWIIVDWDGDGHGTHVAGTVAGDNFLNVGVHDPGDGMAHTAKLVIQDVQHRATSRALTGIPSDLNDLFQQAYDDGARLHSNSWTTTGALAYSTYSQDLDEFMWNNPDFIVFVANGNDGPATGTVTAPATAKNCVSVGATQPGDLADEIANFSSRGPTLDNRYKPTVCLPGSSINSAQGDTEVSPPTYNCGLVRFSGTSMATPGVAGLTTLVREYFIKGYYPSGASIPGDGFTPSASLLKSVLVNSAADMTGTDHIPAETQGWGRVLLDNALYFTGESRKLFIDDYTAGLATGEETKYYLSVSSSSEPLKVTLVWTDYFSTPAASVNLVNNLNLTVEGPGGMYYGNNFIDGVSITGGSPDELNVEENVSLTIPEPGAYTFTVTASNVPSGPQPYAIVISGAISRSYGTIRTDSPEYGCDSPTMDITVFDEDLTGTGSISVSVWSDTETTAETVGLTETPAGSGNFTGGIVVEVAAPVPDGKIQVVEGDTIYVLYHDADDGTGTPGDRILNAVVDCTPPVISNVRVISRTLDGAVIAWDTDEQSDSTVYYSIPPALPVSANDPRNVTAHQVTLNGLISCGNYQFSVESRDHAGNKAVDNNGGALYPFQTLQRGTVYFDDLETSGLDVWTHVAVGGIDDWQWGTPRGLSGDPSSAYSGLKCYGNDLGLNVTDNGAYENNSVNALVSDFIDCTRFREVRLNFKKWLRLQRGRDFGIIAASNGQTWFYFDTMSQDTSWKTLDIDISDHADGNPEVQMIFILYTDAAGTEGGWNIDDFSLTALQECGQDLDISNIWVDDSVGSCTDSDNNPDAGEIADYHIDITNYGAKDALNTNAFLSTSSPWVNILSPDKYIGTIPGNMGVTTVVYRTANELGAGCMENAPFLLALTATGYNTDRTFNMTLEQDINLVVDDWADDLESSVADWVPIDSWFLTTSDARSATHSWNGGASDQACDFLLAPIQNITATTQLQFWCKYDLEDGYDGGIVMISTNLGRSFVKLALSPPYPGMTNSDTNLGTSCELSRNEACFTGTDATWKLYTADLSIWDGEQGWIAFHVATDEKVANTGWFIDDITITNVSMNKKECDDTDCPPLVPITKGVKRFLFIMFGFILASALIKRKFKNLASVQNDETGRFFLP